MAKPARRSQVDGHDERNLARLSLVLATNRVPADMTSWTKEYPSLDGVGVTLRVECTAPRKDVVPHGVDNDVLLGLVNAYVAAGMPDSGVVRVTAYALLQYSSLGDSGFHYATLESSLRRLQGTVYKISDSWFDNQDLRFRSVNTSLVLKFVVTDRDRRPELLGQIRAESLLEITLDSDLASSIRSGYIRPLDITFLRRLQQPLPRLLFRLLSEQRSPYGQPQVSSFQVNLRAWAQHLGILDTRPSRIRRSLEPAHQQLSEHGFLASVDYFGRGDALEILYTFAETSPTPADPEAVALLRKHGVSHAVAVQQASEHGLSTVRERVARFEQLVAAGYKARNGAALLVDLMRHPAKYPLVPLPGTAPVPLQEGAAAKPGRPQSSPPRDPEPLLEPPRTAASARILLRGVPLTDMLVLEAAALFVEERVSIAELMALRHDPDPARTITLWGARRMVSSSEATGGDPGHE
ncbi:replication initiator protein A [Deinococcus hopiensis]|nr:replication initiator protein A [Deinococcus hopiensis]